MLRRLVLAVLVLGVFASSADASAEKTHRAANRAVEWWVGAFAAGDVHSVDSLCMKAFRRPGTWTCFVTWTVRSYGRNVRCHNDRVTDSPDYITWKAVDTHCNGRRYAYRARH